MLFGEEPGSGGWWTGVGGIVTALLTAGGSAYILLRKDRREARKDVIGEWKETTDNLRAELKEVKAELHAVRNDANTRILDLYGKHKACEAENAAVKAENAAMKTEMARMEEEIKELQRDSHDRG
jgi:peptidoglycan hydrolase CwlO-like protein